MVEDFPFDAGGTRRWRLQEDRLERFKAATASEGLSARKATGSFGGRHALLIENGSAAGPAADESDFVYRL